MIFFTSDTHFGHKGVIDYCHRPFVDPVAMDEALIKNWNETVSSQDTVYHIGDVSFRGMVETTAIIKRLNGFKILVRGNHDHRPSKMLRTGFDVVLDFAGLALEKRVQNETTRWKQILMSHYPYRDTYQDLHKDGTPRDFSDRQIVDNNMWLLHGHVHSMWKVYHRMINVGVDVWNFRPVSEKQIWEEIEHAERKRQGVIEPRLQ